MVLYYKMCILHTVFSMSPCPCPSLKRELQYLADQEKISPAAIKKTTLDKVLQQPGVSAETVGVRSQGISMFNNKPRTKKN